MRQFKLFNKLWELFQKRDKRQSYLILGLMLIGTILELLGIGLVVPVFAVIGDPQLIHNYSSLDPILALIGSPSHELIIIYTMMMLLIIYIVKVLFLSLSTYKQSNFIYRFSAKLSSHLFALYVRQPYAFHLNRNSAQLIRNVITDVVMLGSVVQSTIIILTEILVLISMFFLLLMIEPLGAIISMGALSIAGWIYHRLTKNRILSWGKAHHNHAVKRFQFVQEGLGASKDVKLLGREKDFTDQFDDHNYKMFTLTEKQYTLSQLPRLFIELLSIALLVLVVLSMIAFDRDVKSILPTLALFAAAAFRLMPSFNRILANIHTVQYALPSVESIYDECKTLLNISPSKTAKVYF
jgi:ABC-type multidrug transport system fused ATPase/permease subunit